MRSDLLTSKRIESPDTLDDINNLYYQNGWTDGLPIVPPTEDRVARMLQGCNRDPSEVIGLLSPRMGAATVEKIAINSVMAGCLPEYLPVVLAGVKAVSQEAFNLGGVQATTGGPAPLMIVNGPIRNELNLNSGPSLFGPGWRSNATIGRAMRLVLINVAGGIPGVMDKSTFGHPGKYSYCIAENEEVSPWEPLHVEKGFSPEESTVMVAGCGGPRGAGSGDESSGHALMRGISRSLAATGGGIIGRDNQIILILGPEHAKEIAEAGFTKRDIRQFIYWHARRPLGRIRGTGITTRLRDWPVWVDDEDPEETIPIVTWPENIIVMVAGGDGRISTAVSPWTTTRAQIVDINTLHVLST